MDPGAAPGDGPSPSPAASPADDSPAAPSPAAASPADDLSDVPSCTTGPGGRFSFVVRELADLGREVRERRAARRRGRSGG